MKAYVSIDMEGLPGVASTTMISPERTQFQRASKVMTLVAKWVSESLLSAGFSEVYVADSHGLMTNVDYLEMPSGVRLIQGYPRPFSMLAGLDSSFAAALFVGYHAAAGTPRGFLDHTMSGRVIAEVFLNGLRASEFLLNALYARERGVPVILVAGDFHLKSEVEQLSPGTVFVELKRGLSRYAASYPPLPEVEASLRKGVEEAAARLKSGQKFGLRVSGPYNLVVRLRDPLVADVVEAAGAERLDAYTVRREFERADELLSFVETLVYVGLGVEYLKASIK